MKRYRYSPINTKAKLLEAVEYIVKQTTLLLFNLEGQFFVTEYVTIFAHYQDEYEALLEICAQLGESEETNNGMKYILREPLKILAGRIEVNGNIEDNYDEIKYLRIRKPDPYRMQVGCCDLDLRAGYYYLENDVDVIPSDNKRKIVRPDLEMLEFFHPDYDVLAYGVKTDENSRN